MPSKLLFTFMAIIFISTLAVTKFTTARTRSWISSFMNSTFLKIKYMVVMNNNPETITCINDTIISKPNDDLRVVRNSTVICKSRNGKDWKIN